MGSNERHLFAVAPGGLKLYRALRNRILAKWPDVTYRVGQARVTFFNSYGFVWIAPAAVSEPDRTGALRVSFKTGHRLAESRVAGAEAMDDGTWTQWVSVAKTSDIDAQLFEWLAQSYELALAG